MWFDRALRIAIVVLLLVLVIQLNEFEQVIGWYLSDIVSALRR